MTATPDYLADSIRQSVKLLVVGSFGAGKTTLIGSVSEIEPLRTEETMTAASVGIDDLAGLPGKETTTVALDFGRITLNAGTVLYLFGMPGQSRFWDPLDDLADGSVGALVLVDTRRLEASFDILGRLEVRGDGLPFAVAVNMFPDSAAHGDADLRQALDLKPDTPLVRCDARDRVSSLRSLIALTRYALSAQDAHPSRKGPA